MQLIQGKDFWQDSVMRRYMEAKGLTEEPGGACFRYACKWLLCKLYDKQFKTWDATLKTAEIAPEERAPLQDFSNVKGFDKQAQYIKAVASFEKPRTPYADFLSGVRAESKKFIELWGNKAGKYAVSVQDRECLSLVKVKHLFDTDCSFIVGIFGTLRKSPTVNGRMIIQMDNWAHAFAYYRRGNEKRFFDSNGGEFGLGDEDPVAAIEKYAQKFYTGFEKGYSFTRETLNFGSETQPKLMHQFERDLSERPAVSYEKGCKTLVNFVLFELKKK